MKTSMIPFYEFIENLSDDTGYENLEPAYEKIKRWILRASQRLGFNNAQIFKSIPYTVDGTNWNGKKLYLPFDCILIENLYIDSYRVDESEYEQYGDFILLKTTRPETSTAILYYYAIMHDSEGNPLMLRGHNEAHISFCMWKLFAAKAFLEPSRNSRRVVRDYEQDWKDNRDAAIGEDVFPINSEQYDILSSIMNFSTKDAIVYNCYGNYENELIVESKEECVLRPAEKNINVYAWQFPDTLTNIDYAPNIGQTYLDDNATKYTLDIFKSGVVVPYNRIGRIGFAVQGGASGEYNIYDTFNSDVTDLVFDRFFNPILGLDIFISKEFYSHSNIFFKLKDA